MRQLAGVAILSAAAIACGGGTTTSPPDRPGPTGNARVTWRVVSAMTGERLDCGVLGFPPTVEIALGGAPKEADCTAGSILFERLLADRYPVFGKLEFGAAVLDEAAANVDVVAGSDTTVELTFEIEPTTAGSGGVLVRWLIDQRLPVSRCAEVGATSVRIRSLEGSIDDVDETVECAGGETTITPLRTGGYTLALRLQDASGTQVGLAQTSDPFTVEASKVAMPTIVQLTTSTTARQGRVVGLFTVSGTVASAGCTIADAQKVRMRVRLPRQGGGIETTTGTAACSLGRVEVRALRQEFYEVQLELLDFVDVALTSTIVRDVFVSSSRTTTVGVDLTP